ncbi:MAG TPA: selenoneine biosynthesis selenosugar synthase SenB [Caldimonas sp.]|nr:selenoneine biosynthesis selenosugar synthase SenB [Caldimonas sp.]HEV7576544.1 selenoneine biosynthesis selenosugar synthase SenB [Caldimonas sp.]
MEGELLPRVRIVSPALASANNGNWHTAARWQRFLAPVARVEIVGVDAGADGADARADLLIALHARRSARPIAAWRERRRDAPIVVVLTGTDLYRDLDVDAGARHSLECASRIVVLQDEGLARLDATSRAKAVVIVQSAPALHATRGDGDADLVAVGHLRDEKDPQTLWRAARLLGADRDAPTIAHVGAALDARLADEARATMAACPSYRWLGALSHAAARRAMARARALVHPSRIEGGANVVIEAVRSGVPVLASRIDGNVGLLGGGYDGYFPVGDGVALAALARRFCADVAFAASLRAQCAAREPLFRPAAERRAVRALVDGLLPARRRSR